MLKQKYIQVAHFFGALDPRYLKTFLAIAFVIWGLANPGGAHLTDLGDGQVGG